jgi:hypothetical protein
MNKEERHQLKIKKIQSMKNPVIFMNSNVFESLRQEIESKTNIKISKEPTFNGYRIRIDDNLEGNMIVFADEFDSKLKKKK